MTLGRCLEDLNESCLIAVYLGEIWFRLVGKLKEKKKKKNKGGRKEKMLAENFCLDCFLEFLNFGELMVL